MKRLTIPDIAGLIVAVLLISLFCAGIRGSIISSRYPFENDTSMSSLKEIGLGIMQYKQDHHGRLPESWNAVMPYLGGASFTKYLLKCADSSQNPCYTCSARENVKDNDPLCWMSMAHKRQGLLFEYEYRFVLYGDGHTKRLSEKEFEQLTLPQKKFTF